MTRLAGLDIADARVEMAEDWFDVAGWGFTAPPICRRNTALAGARGYGVRHQLEKGWPVGHVNALKKAAREKVPRFQPISLVRVSDDRGDSARAIEMDYDIAEGVGEKPKIASIAAIPARPGCSTKMAPRKPGHIDK